MSKSKFRTQYDRIEVNSNPGSRFVKTYKPVYTDTGALDLVIDGKIDVYEQIQSFKESCDIQTILKRFENGDVNALNAKLPYFADITEIPIPISLLNLSEPTEAKNSEELLLNSERRSAGSFAKVFSAS